MHRDFMIEQGEGARFQRREGEGEGEREILGMFLCSITCHGITGMIPCPKTVLEIILEITPRPYRVAPRRRVDNHERTTSS